MGEALWIKYYIIVSMCTCTLATFGKSEIEMLLVMLMLSTQW